MNGKFIKILLILVSSLMAQTVFSDTSDSVDALLIISAYKEVADVDANIADRYALPPSKAYIAPCQREVLSLHPGVIEKQRILHRHGGFWMRYEIQEREGSEWFMLCDLATGKIIHEQRLVDDIY